MKRNLLLLLLIGFVFIACRKEAKVADEQVVNVEVKNCAQKIFGDASVFLCFDSLLQDSRCPPNANIMCVWQGVAQARFSFTSNNQQHQFVLSTNKVLPNSITDTTIQQYTISLVNIYPYPIIGRGPTIAEVRIRR